LMTRSVCHPVGLSVSVLKSNNVKRLRKYSICHREPERRKALGRVCSSWNMGRIYWRHFKGAA
jgi:hypothetical protein